MIKPLGLAAKELIHHRCRLDMIKPRQVYDSGAEFFVVTGIEYSANMVFVTGDKINDTEWIKNIRMGRSAMMALYPDKYLEDVSDSHVYGEFYKNTMPNNPEEF